MTAKARRSNSTDSCRTVRSCQSTTVLLLPRVLIKIRCGPIEETSLISILDWARLIHKRVEGSLKKCRQFSSSSLSEWDSLLPFLLEYVCT